MNIQLLLMHNTSIKICLNKNIKHKTPKDSREWRHSYFEVELRQQLKTKLHINHILQFNIPDFSVIARLSTILRISHRELKAAKPGVV